MTGNRKKLIFTGNERLADFWLQAGIRDYYDFEIVPYPDEFHKRMRNPQFLEGYDVAIVPLSPLGSHDYAATLGTVIGRQIEERRPGMPKILVTEDDVRESMAYRGKWTSIVSRDGLISKLDRMVLMSSAFASRPNIPVGGDNVVQLSNYRKKHDL